MHLKDERSNDGVHVENLESITDRDLNSPIRNRRGFSPYRHRSVDFSTPRSRPRASSSAQKIVTTLSRLMSLRQRSTIAAATMDVCDGKAI
jgi:hypothetical protein